MNVSMNCEELENCIQEILYQSKGLPDKAELSEKVRQYFSWYQERLENSKKLTADILEMQGRLSRIKTEQKDIKAHNRKLETLAMYDPLTGLANRGYLNEYLSQKFEDALEKKISLGVELMDIDYFKSYNDTYGHMAGDICIESVSKVLKNVQNQHVFCARYGGDEFMIVYSEMTVKEIQSVVDTIQEKVRDLKLLQEHEEGQKGVTVTQGVFICVPQEENREWDFNSMADTALYHAKREGRNRYRIVTGFDL